MCQASAWFTVTWEVIHFGVKASIDAFLLHRFARTIKDISGEKISNPYEQNRQVNLLSESEWHMFGSVQPCGQEVNCQYEM